MNREESEYLKPGAFEAYCRAQVERLRLQLSTSEQYRDQLRRVNLTLHRIFLNRLRRTRELDAYLLQVLHVIGSNLRLIREYEAGIIKYHRRLLILTVTPD